MVDPRDYDHVIHVDPSNSDSVNNVSCHDQSKQTPCKDINFALAFPNRGQSTIFILSPDASHNLTNNTFITVFSESSSVAFSGDNGTAVVECMDGAGLAFLNSTNITFNGVSFQKCGAWRDSTSRDFSSNSFQLMQIRVGLYFYNCRDVTMVNMSVLNSTEAVGVVMYSTAGVNNISHSQFDSNRISESNKNESGGGGFAVEFNYCKPGDNSCNETNYQTENNHNAVYMFEHCSFSNNRAIDQSEHNQTSFSILPHKETHSALGRGGGFSLYFKGNATNITITLSDCTFHHNHATWGAGILVVFADSSIQNSVNIFYGNFTENHTYHTESNATSSGGGVFAGSVVYNTEGFDKMYQRNSVVLKHCVFSSNVALLGGALSLAYHRQPFSHKYQLFQVNVSWSSFLGNSARLGSAVSINNDHHFTLGELGTVFFDTCNFSDNTIAYVNTTRPYSVGVGAVYISEVSVTFLGYIYFFRNNGTALAVAGTSVVFSTNASVTFSYNHGSSGGAIALLGAATLVVGENTSFTFKNNSATLYGGAIYNNYIGKEDLRSSAKCFLQCSDPFKPHEKWTASFQFKGNKAGKLGQSIFSSTILPCLWSSDNHINMDAVSKVFCWNDSTWVYENSSCSEEINTYPQMFNFTNASHVIFPGHKFQLNIQALDDLNHDVSNETVYTAVSNTSSFEVDPGYTYISGGDVVVTGLKEQHLTLELNTANTRDWHLQLHLIMEKCPPGFEASGKNDTSKSVCSCLGGDSLYSFSDNLLCDRKNLVSRIRNGYWIGKVSAIENDSTLFVGATSLLYNYTREDFHPIAKIFEHLDRNQCLPFHRTGPLCGECIEGYSTAVNSYSYECVPCTSNTSNTTNLAANIAAYIGLTYVPYLIVFIVIIYFDVRLMSGPLVGFILYAQLISSGAYFDSTMSSFQYSKNGSNILHNTQKAYRLIYGVFNLNSFSVLMPPFCVREQFSALDVICLDFGVALFPLVLLLVVFIRIRLRPYRLCKKWRSTTRRTAGGSVLHVIVSFIYLFYTKLVLASVRLITTISVIKSDGSFVTTPSKRLIYYAGQYKFSDCGYLPYGLTGIIVFVFVGICLPLLLLGPLDLINWLLDKPKCKCLHRVWPSVRVNIFLEAFRNYYKPERRYFAGIYFLYKLVMLSVYAFSAGVLSVTLWQLVFTILMIILVALFQPHKYALYNYIDLILLFNIAAIIIIHIAIYASSLQYTNGRYPMSLYNWGLFFVWLPLFYFLLFLIWFVLQKTKVYQRVVQHLQQRISIFLSTESKPEEQRLLTDPVARHRTKTQEEQDLFRRAEEVNQYKAGRKVTTAVVDVHGTSGIASVRPGTNDTNSSGIGTNSTSNSLGIESYGNDSSFQSY